MFGYFPTDIRILLARVIVLFTAITVHEFSHGFVAYKLGDPTAKYNGRLTLNPIAHLDIWGALCMVFMRFGWAKPVPINPMYFRNRKRDSALCALAGPVSNIILAFFSAILAALYYSFVIGRIPLYFDGFLQFLISELAGVNIGFALFNLIPFPPLDGSKILGAFLPDDKYNKLLMYERIGFPILMILSFTGVLGSVISLFGNPIIRLWNATVYGLMTIMM